MTSWIRTALDASLLLLTFACGGIVADPGGGSSGTSGSSQGSSSDSAEPSQGTTGSGGTMPGGDGDPALEGKPIFSAQDVSFTLEQAYLGARGECIMPFQQSYTYDRTTHVLTKRCDPARPLAERDAAPPLSRVLDAAEVESVEAKLSTLRYSKPPTSPGWDGSEVYLKVGSRTYSLWNINGYDYPNAPKLIELAKLLETMPF